ncbi:hypothetical protein F4677DRAFT_240445 [Hypoxylon crocopeplum]|nr:hypothetical protein F4677DRAFT_240445 [Hypoxylon crocopeplum]
MLFNIVSLLGLAAVAVALPAEEAACPRIRCIDGISKCGVKYGRCYDMCTQDMPPPPPCPPTITSALPNITSSASATTITSACTSTGTACVDILKTCGSPPTAILTYGGCFPECGPSPTFTPPPCPTPSTADVPTITP